MSDMINKQKSGQMIDTREYMASEQNEYDINRQEDMDFLQKTNVNSSKKEAYHINLFIKNTYLTDEVNLPDVQKIGINKEHQLAFLNRKSMDQGHSFTNDLSRTDSPQMEAIKRDVRTISEVFDELSALPVTSENLDRIEESISKAIDSCIHYIENKDPWTTEGKKRMEKVRKIKLDLSNDHDDLVLKRQCLNPGYDGEVPASIGALLKMKAC